MNHRLVDRLFASAGIGGCLGALVLMIASVAGWITHVVHCFKTQEWLLLIAGAIAAPLGVVHGWGLWFGWWG